MERDKLIRKLRIFAILTRALEIEKEVESKPLIIDSVVGKSEQLFCGVKDGFCPYEESDNKCRAEHKCINQVAK